jgi:DNA-binding NtrC family response regulator
MKRTVLVVDDEQLICELLETGLGDLGYAVHTCPGGAAALKLLESTPVDLVLSDIRMEDMNGLQFLEKLRERHPDLLVMMMTAHASVDNAIQAMKLGAFDYIQKPCTVPEVDHRLRKAFEHKRLLGETRFLRSRLEQSDSLGAIIGRNARMKQIFDMLKTVARSDSSILIQGENGTGKELVARAVHKHSNRADKLFLAKNCAAIPDQLLESELFGHVRGAFTGATGERKGIFEEADGGTLFLDEISEMPLGLQAKLLRVLQEGELQRVGSNEVIKVDVRILSSTNRDLQKEVAKGSFRKDLYFRLNVIPVTLPPLRERKDDIPLLAESFLKKFSEKMGVNILGISEDGMRWLLAQPWEGNVRELENAIERAVVMANRNVLDAACFAPMDSYVQDGAEPEPLLGEITIHEMEKRLILSTLRRFDNNRTRSAESLGISIRTLRNKLHEYRQEDPELAAIIDKGETP